MRVKFSPIGWNENAKLPFSPNTQIEFLTENSVLIDGETYEFDEDSQNFPDIMTQSDGMFLDAHRDDIGELYLTIRRFYTDTERPEWDTGGYHEIHGQN